MLADRAISIGGAATELIRRGLAFVSAWGTECARIEADFDSAIVDRNPRETADDVILTTSHSNDSVEGAVEFFLFAQPASACLAECNIWDIVATSAPLLAAVERVLESRGAKRLETSEGRKMNHSYFGPLDATNGVDWTGNVQVNDLPVSLDMTSDTLPSTAQLDAVAAIARDVSRFDPIAREALAADSGDDSSVTLYIEHHLSELAPDALNAAFGTKNPTDVSRPMFLERMILQRVGLYPESRTHVAVFDYTLDARVTQYVLSVAFDADGVVTSVDMES
jgi:hypothetical protein